MRLNYRIGLLVAAFILSNQIQAREIAQLSSPDKKITVSIDLDKQGQLSYEIVAGAEPILNDSPLGITLNNTVFNKQLNLTSVSKQSTIHNSYKLFTGKQKFVDYNTNSTVVSVSNAKGHALNIRFQVSNDGVAFRYELPGKSTDTRVVLSEKTGFNFPKNTRAWLQPKDDAQTGWMNTNPSYEEEYLQATSLNTAQITKNGWVFPALFKQQDLYILLSEAVYARVNNHH